jgi:hypothetical protein
MYGTLKSFGIISLMVCLITVNGWAAKPEYNPQLTDVNLINTRDDLLLYLKVQEAISPKMKEAILSGAPVSFQYSVKIIQLQSWWFDLPVAEVTVSQTVKHNVMKKNFIVSRSWKNGPPIMVQTFEEARDLMISVDGLKIVPLQKLEKGKPYRVKIKAKLDELKLPLYLHYLLKLISMGNIETPWHTIEFIY